MGAAGSSPRPTTNSEPKPLRWAPSLCRRSTSQGKHRPQPTTANNTTTAPKKTGERVAYDRQPGDGGVPCGSTMPRPVLSKGWVKSTRRRCGLVTVGAATATQRALGATRSVRPDSVSPGQSVGTSGRQCAARDRYWVIVILGASGAETSGVGCQPILELTNAPPFTADQWDRIRNLLLDVKTVGVTARECRRVYRRAVLCATGLGYRGAICRSGLATVKVHRAGWWAKSEGMFRYLPRMRQRIPR